MANVYNHRRHHHHHHHHLLHHKTAILLPMFCRLSLKDINLNHRNSSLSDEPTSPKVGCMGQIKRNNRVTATGLPPAAASTPTHHHKYSKLKKLFSSKALLPPTSSLLTAGAAAAAVGGRSKSCRSSKEVCVDNLRRLKLKKDSERDYAKIVNIEELDQPLPVVKRAAPPVSGEVNLWKRRFNGVSHIEKIHLPNSNTIPQPPTV